MTSIEAMWTVHFDGPGGEDFSLAGGVVVFETGRIFGGDSGYAYLGSFKVEGAAISGSVRVIRHDPNITSIFGDVDEVQGTFTGTRISDTRIDGRFDVPGGPPAMLRMSRLAELP